MLKKILITIIVLLATSLYPQAKLRISIENSDSHIQAQTVKIFAEKLEKRLAGKIKVEFNSGAKLFRDQNVISAIALGRVEMAVPGTWQIDKYVPEVGLFLLPDFYGREAEIIYSVNNSSLGDLIVSRVEEELGVKVLGSWIDLGHALIFSNKNKISSYADFKNKNIRVAGGLGNQKRIETLGANPVSIAFPDLSEKLSQGGIDGVLTSYETIRSIKLWEDGIKYAFEDNQYFAQYIPIISTEFWDRLTPDVQKVIVDTWEEGIYEARMKASESQKIAKDEFISNGGLVYKPSNLELILTRDKLKDKRDEIAEGVGIPNDLLFKLDRFFDTW